VHVGVALTTDGQSEALQQLDDKMHAPAHSL
jgi:hypothetical protein